MYLSVLNVSMDGSLGAEAIALSKQNRGGNLILQASRILRVRELSRIPAHPDFIRLRALSRVRKDPCHSNAGSKRLFESWEHLATLQFQHQSGECTIKIG